MSDMIAHSTCEIKDQEQVVKIGNRRNLERTDQFVNFRMFVNTNELETSGAEQHVSPSWPAVLSSLDTE